jgi:hypothetical protein
MKTSELETRLRHGLASAERIELANSELTPRQRAVGRSSWIAIASIALVGLGVIGSASTWKSRPTETPIAFADGEWTTPADDVLATDWLRGPLERELGTSTGDPTVGLLRAIESAETGCLHFVGSSEGNVLQAVQAARAMTQRQFVERYGFGDLDDVQREPECGRPERSVPPEVRTALKSFSEVANSIAADQSHIQMQIASCVLGIDPDIAKSMDRHRKAINDFISSGRTAKEDIALRNEERALAVVAFRCTAPHIAELKSISDAGVGEYLSNPGNAVLMQAARTFIEEMNVRAA